MSPSKTIQLLPSSSSADTLRVGWLTDYLSECFDLPLQVEEVVAQLPLEPGEVADGGRREAQRLTLLTAAEADAVGIRVGAERAPNLVAECLVVEDTFLRVILVLLLQVVLGSKLHRANATRSPPPCPSNSTGLEYDPVSAAGCRSGRPSRWRLPPGRTRRCRTGFRSGQLARG